MAWLPDEIDRRLEGIEALLMADPAWRAELEASRGEYAPDSARRAGDPQFRRRHLEWFLLERSTDGAPDLAIDRVAARWPAESGLSDEAALKSLRHSRTGIFEVTSVAPGEGMWLADLATRGEYPVLDEQAANVLEPGDLIAGRLFPVAGDVHRVSSTAAFHRDQRLLTAVRSDLEAARERQRGVVRVGQRDIERMFFSAADATPQDPVGDARALLLAGGVEPAQVEAWLGDLAQAPFDEDRLVHGASDALAAILDQLAFETSVDLDTARRALLHAWTHLVRSGPGQGAAIRAPVGARTDVPEAEVSRALQRFEQRSRAGEPLGQLLDELERELDLADESDDDGDDTVPDFPGVVGAMVEEFLWQTERASGAAAAAQHAVLRSLGRSAAAVGAFEDLNARDLLTYATWWLPESGLLTDAEAARVAVASLSAFCRWAEDEQHLPLHTDFGPTLASLGSSLPRTAQANQLRTRAAGPTDGELLEVTAVDGGRLGLRDRQGSVHTGEVETGLASWLRPGDRLRASLHADGRLAVYCCYPPEVAGLAASAG